MTELHRETTGRPGELRPVELVIDVRKNHGRYTTAEACCQDTAGVNIVRHGARDEEPHEVITALVESIESLGIRPESYRIVREDLPPRIVIEFREGSS